MEFRILGSVEAVEDDRIELRGRRTRTALAAFLLDAERVVPISQLVDALWDESPPPTSTRQVQHCISVLRQAFKGRRGQPRILTEGTGYRLSLDGATLDSREFLALAGQARSVAEAEPARAVELMRRALELWRGRALADVSSPSLAHRATYLDEQRLVVWEECLELELQLGRHESVVSELIALSAAHPLRERPAELAMTALGRCGRRAEALSFYQGFRAHLVDEMGIDPGSRMQALHQSLLRGDDPSSARPAAAPVRQTPASSRLTPPPAELPADISTFTGRAAELATLDRLLVGPHAPVVNINGIAGSGKTTLAVHWAHGIASRFPDGLLHVNLRGHDPGPALDATAALSQLLRSLGVPPAVLPTHPDELAGRFRTVTASRRLLILLDDASDDAQILPLLPGSPGCAVIITSRGDLPALSARTDGTQVTLGPFDSTESVNLLRLLLPDERGRDEDRLRRLSELCGGLPVALRLTGERLRRRSKVSLETAIQELTGPDRLDHMRLPGDPGVRATFDASYRAQPMWLRGLWRSLAIAPLDTFTVEAAAALADLDEPDARSGLEQLAATHLLEALENGRYGFHELLRIYAAERHEEEDGPAMAQLTIDRLLDWMAVGVDAAHRRLRPEHPVIDPERTPAGSFEHAKQALEWLDAEAVNIARCARQAAEHRPRRCWQLAAGMHGWLAVRGNRREWIALYRVALDAARRSGDLRGQRLIHHGLAVAHSSLDQYAKARTSFRVAISLATATGQSHDALWTYAILTGLELEHERYDDAAQTVAEALRILPTGPRRPQLEATLLRHQGELHLRAGRFEAALAPLHQARTLLTGIGADLCRSYVEIALGQLHEAREEPHLARRHYLQALRLVHTRNDNRLIASARLRMGAFLAKHGPAEEAREHLMIAAEKSRLLDDTQTAEAQRLLASLGRP
ncbi:SARP family transcriptional regulator [Actinorhabdospora filicis]|uniref:SARP family transcriptional regulator n=1 Tax=Actinorhabdospora filicis TaxID=1785913 RepID=A0A9W6SNU4_9ACTN|nr:SARP family transcriptional regulator [Actinorhabdospora filicis]